MERLTEKIDGSDHYRLKSGYGFLFRYAESKAQETIDKLAEYEDLEEQGKLLKLPCAVGDTVYTLNPLSNEKIVIAETPADTFFCALCALEGRFEKTVFTTMEEAQSALNNLTQK